SALALPGPETWDDPFTLEVLLLRRRGFDLALLIQDTPDNRACLPSILLALDQVRAVFPRLRLACVVYDPSGLNTLDFGIEPSSVASALAAPAAPPPAGAAASGLAAAITRAAGLAWSPKAASVVLILAADAPWVAEIPPIWDTARDMAARRGTRTAWASLTLAPGAPPPGEASRLTTSSSVLFLPLHSPSQLGAELLRLVLGDGRVKDIERICRVTAENTRNP
ncbi:MAG TPA: hypothetical protein P5137_17720, partial [Candidatus Brocadiia bacterium]|nr:hypothetical protein [Candidatus Brocadiia bacterium]